jgi:hypothetical protein
MRSMQETFAALAVRLDAKACRKRSPCPVIATAGGRKLPVFMDNEVIGFGVQVRENGQKSFTLDYMFEGRRDGLMPA